MARETADEINEAAGLWAVRQERGLTDAEAAAFQQWLDGDSRRLGAYGRMAVTLKQTQRAAALGPSFDLRTLRADKPAELSRRQWLVGGGAVAASVAGGGVFLAVRPKTYSTRKGEKRVVALADGSVVTMNTATRLAVSYSDARRSIRLDEGEALFDVAKDAKRPFIVSAGGTQVRAVGTSFTVARLARAPVQILVQEGVVDVSRPKRPQEKATRLAANMRAVVAQQAAPLQVASIDAADVGRELAWQEGRIVIQRETLATAAARFARYSDTRIIIDDPALAAEEVSGVFEANDPITFAKSMALSLDGHAEVGVDEVRITR
jgi:transmembrane sensor